ncbi:hypothetical protein REPUB_Repub17cG0087100 [Reevesia pubescens]
MKFRKGNSVEVLRREHDPCGSWFTGNIRSADADNYVVRYKLLMDHEGKQVVEKVREKDVRPLPPSVNGKSWAVGDIVEVFEIQCWRVGKVAKVLKNNNRFVIKFFGSIQLKEFHASSLRIRQVWQGNKWMVIGKVAQGKDLANSITPKISSHAGCLHFRTSLDISKTLRSKENREGQHTGGAENVMCNMDKLFGGTLGKRKLPPCSRGYDETLKRTLPLFNQVDDSSCPLAGADEKFSKQSTNSCSFNGVADYAGQISHKSLENTHDNSDAESSFPSLGGKRDLPLSPVDKVVDIHDLELRAYKSTVEALYASGPLSWEQESLLTNLRLSLNISDEEHLLQLRHLLSAQVL